MATTKPRLNVTLSKQTKAAISQLAAHQAVPDATYAAQLIETALELEEDVIWNRLAGARDKSPTKYQSHTQAWGQ